MKDENAPMVDDEDSPPDESEDGEVWTDYVAVILAGGEGRRMGRNKLLMDISSRPIIRHVVETVRGVVGHVVVVTGYQHERIAEALQRLPVILAVSEPESGARAAMKAGLARIRDEPSHRDCPGIIVCVGDQPRLTRREIIGLLRAWKNTDRTRPLVPVRGDRRGYPVVVPANFDSSTLDLSDEELPMHCPDGFVSFITKNPVYDSSLDTPEDYRTFFSI